MNYDIFVSYATADKAFVDAIVHSLEASNIRCWYAPRDIPTGMEWPAAITAAIKASTLMLLVFSKNSNDSLEVAKELAVASKNSRLVVPVNLDRTVPSEQMEYHLTNKHWLDIYNLETETAIKRVHDCLLEYESKFKASKLEQSSPIRKAPPPPPPPPPPPAQSSQKARDSRLLILVTVAILVIGTVAIILSRSSDSPAPIPVASAPVAKQAPIQPEASKKPQPSPPPSVKPVTPAPPKITPDDEFAKASKLIQEKSYSEGIVILEKLAQSSYAKAELSLADMYYSGLGVKADTGKAAALYQRAANKGMVDAQYALACMYEQGEGIEQDIVKAIALFQKAAKSGHGDSMYSLGNLHEYGTGVTQSSKLAFDWFLQSARAGNVAAQYKAGIMYYQGIGVQLDQAEGLNWLYKAADAGDELAKSFLKQR